MSRIMCIFAVLKVQCGTSMPPQQVAFVVSAKQEPTPLGQQPCRVTVMSRWHRTGSHSNAACCPIFDTSV